jgi:hypothetical protein
MPRHKCGWCRSSFKDAQGLIEHMAPKLTNCYLVLRQARNFAIRHSDKDGASIIILAVDSALGEFDHPDPSPPFYKNGSKIGL